MAKTSEHIAELLANLQAVPPADLFAITLLQTGNIEPGTWFPADVPAAKLAAAAKELVQYGERCRAVSDSLKHLSATPIDRSLPEFGL